MAREPKHGTAGGGPLMTLLALLILLLPVLSLGGWLTMTSEGKAVWVQAQDQIASEKVANP
jgi:hypothetical protein